MSVLTILAVLTVLAVGAIDSVGNCGSSTIAENDYITVSVICRRNRVDCNCGFSCRNKVCNRLCIGIDLGFEFSKLLLKFADAFFQVLSAGAENACHCGHGQ